MSSREVSLRRVVQIVAIALLGILGAVQTGSAVVSTTTYYFTGRCSDSTGNGQGTLVLQNYTLGSTLTNANLVTWNYTSNLLTYSVTPGANPTFSIGGSLPATLPGTSLNTVVIANQSSAGASFIGFIAQTSGTWCAGLNCEDDSGTNGTWSAAPAVTQAVPALSKPVLFGLALLLLFAAWILLRGLPRKNAA